MAVIARPRAVWLDACLAALAAADVVAPRLVEIGADGPAQARNAALAGTSSEVLALVEDDVAVEPGWLEAVRTAFADPHVAAAGGPLAGPPGTARVTAQPATYPGGNVALRAAAARGAGGFWPARGDADARDWFSEEHELQRELARQGWRIAFAPGMAAWRLGGPPSLRWRLRTGARRQVVGESRTTGTALRALATGLAGAPLGRRQERLGRAAENLGVLLGERLAGRDFAPVAAQTPFRPSVPVPAVPARRRRSAGTSPRGATVLLYHRIADLDEDPLRLAVSPAHFGEQLDVLRSTRELVPLEAVAVGDAGPNDVAVTFDDGYADNLAVRDAGVPVTVFVSTGHVASASGFWWDAVDAVCRERRGDRVEVEDRAFVLGPDARGHLLSWLQPRPPEQIAAVLDALGAPPGTRAMTVDELRELARHVTIGAHTRTHRSLRHAAPADQRAEIEGCRDDLTSWLGAAPSAFAYPFGVPGDAFDATATALIREAGFSCAVTNAPGPSADRYLIARTMVPNVDGPAFARWLADRR